MPQHYLAIIFDKDSYYETETMFVSLSIEARMDHRRRGNCLTDQV